MSAIRKIIQRQLFQKDDERIQAIVNVSELDGKKKKNQTLLCLAVTIEHPIAVRLYFVKGEKDDTFKKKDRFNLREVREVDGINPKKPSPEFHITIGDRQYVILADSAEEKDDFIRELYKLSCQHLPVQMPDFCNFSLPQLEAEASTIPIELSEHDIAMQSDYQPVSQKEDADFRKLIEKADLTIGDAHLFAEMLTEQLQSLDGANINSMMDSENSVNQLLSSIDAALSGVESVEKELDRCDDILAFVRNSIELIEEKDSLSVVERKNKQRLNDEVITFVKSLEAVTDAYIETLKQANFSNPESSTPPKNLSDMPIDVVGLIVERSDYKEQLILRKVSNSLRAIVDKQKPACAILKISCWDDCIICNYNDHCVAYALPTWDQVEFVNAFSNYHLDTVILRVNYEQVAFDDLASTLKNPKLHLKIFDFDTRFDCDCTKIDTNGTINNKHKEMQSLLKSINHQLSVEACRIDIWSCHSGTSILSYLKPGELKKITAIWTVHFDDIWMENYEAMERIALLQQWKQAKELVVETEFGEDFPVKHVTHFKNLHLTEEWISREDFFVFRDLVSEHEDIEFCTISTETHPPFFAFEDLSVDDINHILGTLVSPNLYHYAIPGSKYYMELMFADDLLTIEKKKKKSV